MPVVLFVGVLVCASVVGIIERTGWNRSGKSNRHRYQQPEVHRLWNSPPRREGVRSESTAQLNGRNGGTRCDGRNCRPLARRPD